MGKRRHKTRAGLREAVLGTSGWLSPGADPCEPVGLTVRMSGALNVRRVTRGKYLEIPQKGHPHLSPHRRLNIW
jgi:hypothetical protein